MFEKVWNHSKIAYGGDYNPEQWDEATWAEDMRLFKLAGIDTVTVNVFSWATLQPSEDTYNFEKLDKIMAMCREHGLKVVLATSTAAHPAWMAKKYPEILRTEINGMKRKYGVRHNSCPNSPVYRRFSVALAEQLASRYGHYDNVIAWHVSNEYGGECYCENCENAFRQWLRQRYGTIDNLNKAWNTAFWSHTLYDWDEIVVPNYLSEHAGYDETSFQGISLDYRRFNSDSVLDCYRLESEAIKKYTPHIPVTTNLMEFYKPLDSQRWAKEMDFVSWDCYPRYNYTPDQVALMHELIRGTKKEKPFILMESTPSVTNWQGVNKILRPGVMRLRSYQAIAHGSDSVMFFQMRRSIGACEKYHGAVIDHVGNEHTRVFRELSQLGVELNKLGDKTLGSLVRSNVGILFDWDNWWALEYSTGPSHLLRYREEVEKFYSGLHGLNVSADVIPVDTNFEDYKLLVAPVMYMVKPGVGERLRQFVRNGGTLVTTFFSGYVNETDLVTLGGYPGELRDILGVWVEEIDSLPPEECNYFTFRGNRYAARMLCDLLHTEGAETLAVYEEDFYAGMPVVTEHAFGKGKAFYVATSSDKAFYADLMAYVCQKSDIQPVLTGADGLEVTCRTNGQKDYLFLLNHTKEEKTVVADRDYVDLLNDRAIVKGDPIAVRGIDVRILESK